MARKKDSAKKSAAASEANAKPKKEGRLKQIWQVFQMTRRAEPLIVLWMALIFVGVIGAAFLIGLALDHPVYASILGLPLALLGMTIVLSRRAEAVAYKQIADQQGAVGAALGSIRRGWFIEEQPVAIDPRSGALIFRAVGRAGVVLVSEGNPNRAQALLAKEQRRTERLLPSVPVTAMQCGPAENQIPLPKIARKVQRLKPKLTKAEKEEVERRLRALGGQQLPIPKGVDPMRVRPDRKAMRGR